jgi:LacI family transcriptional regulator
LTRLKDIAEKAGVSIRTVNRVLKNQPNVKKHIVDQVKAIADELQYFPNLTAQSLKTSINNDIILITPSISSNSVESIEGIEKAVMENHLNLKVILTLDVEDISEIIKRAFAQKPKGIIFFKHDKLESFLKYNIAKIPYIVLQGDSDKFNSIEFDRAAGVKESILYLYKNGARRIAYMGFNKAVDIPSKGRLDGYLAGITECGLKPIYLPMPKAQNQFEIAREIGRNFKSLDPMPDAVQCYSDYAALGFMAGLHDKGYNIKETVKIVGFNNAPISRTSSPPLTTVALPFFELGKLAVETILETYSHPKKANKLIQIKL